tara:strand:+ start:1501 stop:2106 length:606 start_codon:yes stop_codon:yes gene_type:complete
MVDLFWFQDPTILFRKDRLMQIWPYENMSFHEKLNATTRFILLISVLGFMVLNNYLILLFGLVLISILILIFNYYKKAQLESMQNMEVIPSNADKHSATNPLYNVLLTDYQDNVNKPEAVKQYNETNEQAINNSVKSFVLENNKDNADIGKIFQNVVNNLDFEKSMRQFHMNPSTTIPNNQDDFLKYCYNDLYSEKPLLIY